MSVSWSNAMFLQSPNTEPAQAPLGNQSTFNLRSTKCECMWPAAWGTQIYDSVSPESLASPSAKVLSPQATPLLRSSLSILGWQSSCQQTGNAPACSWHSLQEQMSGGCEEMILPCYNLWSRKQDGLTSRGSSANSHSLKLVEWKEVKQCFHKKEGHHQQWLQISTKLNYMGWQGHEIQTHICITWQMPKNTLDLFILRERTEVGIHPNSMFCLFLCVRQDLTI
jgi:hypothetical protein